MATRSAANQNYPHLPSGVREPNKQREQSLSAAMYPRPSRDELWWQEWSKRKRDSLLKHLREANANLARGGR
jgi:hypothetical protein